MSIAKEANAACMQAALGKASIAEQAILDQVRSFFASDSWLEGATGADALVGIEDAEFEITRLLTEECGPLGPAFKQSADYENGKRYLNELREKHRAPASNEPATGVPVPTVQVVGAVANPLGFYDDLLSLINDQVVKDERSFKVIFSGLRGESNNSDDKGAWKAAGLGLYTRHKALNPEMELQPFDDLWSDSLDRRFDKRVISNYARMSDKQRYKALCLDKSIESWESKSAFSEMELRDYYIMAYGDNLIRIQDVEKGIGIWYRGRWYWDKRGRILQHEVFNVVHALYNDLLARHAQKKRDLPANEDSEEKKKEIDKLIARTIKSVENFGNQQNKNVVAIIQNQQIAQSLEVDPFDEEPLLFCFTNKVYNFKTNAFQPHFKFDYMLRNCGREWREPTNARVERVQELLESVQPDTDSRKSLLSVLRSCLTGIRPELFIILTGGGRNGKSLIVEWIQFLLATYGLEGHISLLTKAPKSGPYTEYREVHKKRCIVWSEPEEETNEPLRLSNIKMLTGNETQNARGLYNDNSVTRMFATCILECNVPPVILGDKGESARERICFLNFPMTFTNIPEKLAANPDTYRQLDETLKSTAFKENHYCAFFKLLTTTPLLTSVPIKTVHIAEASRVQASTYLDNNDFMPSWITENYSKLSRHTSDNARTFVSIKELYAGFAASDKFANLSKQQKRTYNEGKFREAVAKSNAYKSLFRAANKVKITEHFNGGYNTKDGLIDIVKIDEDDTQSSEGASSSSVMQADPKRQRTAF